MIEYREFGIEHIKDVIRICEEEGWNLYLTDMNDEAVNRFYRSAGFVEYERKNLIGYARQIRR